MWMGILYIYLRKWVLPLPCNCASNLISCFLSSQNILKWSFYDSGRTTYTQLSLCLLVATYINICFSFHIFHGYYNRHTGTFSSSPSVIHTHRRDGNRWKTPQLNNDNINTDSRLFRQTGSGTRVNTADGVGGRRRWVGGCVLLVREGGRGALWEIFSDQVQRD